MNQIQNYIEAMFSALPKTPEALRLQAEMLENAQNQFRDLTASGKSENEAVGIVLASVDSTDEVRRKLGLTSDGADTKPQFHAEPVQHEEVPHRSDSVFTQPQKSAELRVLEQEYHRFLKQFSVGIAVGVALCILALVLAAMVEAFVPSGNVREAAQAAAFFVPVAIGVFLFVYFGIRRGSYEEQLRNYGHRREVENEGSLRAKRRVTHLVSSFLFPIATIFFLFIGFGWGLWHPGWVVFPVCGVLTGIIGAIEDFIHTPK